MNTHQKLLPKIISQKPPNSPCALLYTPFTPQFNNGDIAHWRRLYSPSTPPANV